MNMQDKEFDELFRSRLEDLEVDPSKGLWDNIAAEVVIDRKNRSAFPFIRIAASVLILITAGVFFIPKIKPANTKSPLSAGVVQPKHPNVQITPTNVEEIKQQPVQIAAVNASVKHYSIKQTVKRQNNSLPAIKNESALIEQQVAQVPQVQPANNIALAAVKPDMNTPVNADTRIAADVKVNQLAALTIPQSPAETLAAAATPKKHRIRSFGDLINVVVSKVDKRKDKLIEFSNKDDDESLVTGINLGIVRIKKEEVIATNK
jgi:hypothetical protein